MSLNEVWLVPGVEEALDAEYAVKRHLSSGRQHTFILYLSIYLSIYICIHVHHSNNDTIIMYIQHLQ